MGLECNKLYDRIHIEQRESNHMILMTLRKYQDKTTVIDQVGVFGFGVLFGWFGVGLVFCGFFLSLVLFFFFFENFEELN